MKPSWIVPVKRIIINFSAREWCRLPYPNHPKGCPNYGIADRCPPKAPLVHRYFDLTRPLYLVHSEFDLLSHIERMREKRPDWSDLQLKCVLYWQNKSRKQMIERVSEAVKILRTDRMTACPEAMGVNVFATSYISGLKLERTRDIKICRHITLIGYR